MTGRKTISDDHKRQIIEDYLSGMLINDLYKKYSIYMSTSSIHRCIRNSGVPKRTKAGPGRSYCSELDCLEFLYRRSLCRGHYRSKLSLEKGSCNHAGCDNLQLVKGLCSLHYQRFNQNRPLDKKVAEWVNANGYVCEYIPGHIQANADGRVLQHRKVMSDKLGRKLDRNETVHHINGDKTDNRVENLQLWSSIHPSGQRIEDLVAYAKGILEKYGDIVE